ncbi:MAG: hypothetical protein K1566_05865 [Candidatus Thiodiazotropha sp. (ex. Lucinisca nassula)]|nr:hypothetical protein [Candidatus Thiodiazotropha sp. (ex. Lucinisca nassula)]MBW9269148.1 hypothetical protein [Candidatus Thiodiazotropha sp. (ex. Lucinisca nassula)]
MNHSTAAITQLLPSFLPFGRASWHGFFFFPGRVAGLALLGMSKCYNLI